MRVWSDAKALVNDIYTLTKKFPHEEEFHLKNQMRRSASSIKTNIAEGQGRISIKEQMHYTSISYSSLIELLNHLDTACDQEYLSKEEFLIFRIKIDSIAGQLSALRKTQKSKLQSNPI